MRNGESHPSFYVLVLAGVLASAFFSLTFIINQSLSLAHTSWQWTAALRYFFMVPLLGALLAVRRPRDIGRVTRLVVQSPTPWLIGGTVGFGLFYAPLTFAAAYGPAWLVAGTWQVTIIMGGLLEPWLRQDPANRRATIPWRTLLISIVILIGIGLLQWAQVSQNRTWSRSLPLVLPVLMAAIAYPAGNRWMLSHRTNSSLTLPTLARTYGMTLGSLPFWVIIAIWGYLQFGWPTPMQVLQSLLVALSSGVVATVLFYWATERAYTHPEQLAAIEATQSAEVIFAAIGAVLILGQPLPSPTALAGIGCVILGLIAHSLGRKSSSTSTQESEMAFRPESRDFPP